VAESETGDLREFIRTITLRIERAVQAMDRKTDVLAEEIVRQREEMRTQFAQQREQLEDILAENRAQREALFRILDRLDNGGTAPAA
jgi:microcystin degradation protein MlrC